MTEQQRSEFYERNSLLLVEDNPADVALTVATLDDSDVSFDLRTVGSLREALKVLDEAQIDAVVLDLNLPDSNGLETLRRLREAHADVAVVVVCGANPPGLRREVLAAGAQDFIWKNEPEANFLARCVLYALERFRAFEAHRSVVQLLDANPDAMIVVDAQGIVRYVNESAQLMLARGGNLVGEWLGFSVGAESTEIELVGFETPRIAEMKVVDIEWRGHKALLASIRDVTENRRLAEQLRMAQKMEAVGLLAGGIAHDFNNLLVVLMGNLEFLKDSCEPGDRRLGMVDRMSSAAERARGLTRQLLLLASRQGSRPVSLRPAELVIKLYQMLRRSFPNDIELVFLPSEDVWNVQIDPDGFDQLVMNLTFNAKHALPDGGQIRVTLDNTTLPHDTKELAAGDYVELKVSDDGVGIPPEHLEKIFEPFYSTRTSRSGTGLGLAICQGIVRKAGGELTVESTPGVGSTFTVRLPRSDVPAESTVADDAAPEAGGHESILVVEDDGDVAGSIRHALERRGFRTIHASDGEQAVRTLTAMDGAIDLVVSDVVMPRMGGIELAQWIERERPDLGVLLLTGYTENLATLRDARSDKRDVLLKPFAPIDLARSVRNLLDRPKPDAA